VVLLTVISPSQIRGRIKKWLQEGINGEQSSANSSTSRNLGDESTSDCRNGRQVGDISGPVITISSPRNMFRSPSPPYLTFEEFPWSNGSPILEHETFTPLSRQMTPDFDVGLFLAASPIISNGLNDFLQVSTSKSPHPFDLWTSTLISNPAPGWSEFGLSPLSFQHFDFNPMMQSPSLDCIKSFFQFGQWIPPLSGIECTVHLQTYPPSANEVSGMCEISEDLILRILIFLMDNNLYEDPHNEQVILYLAKQTRHSFLRRILDMSKPCENEIAFKFFTLAVKAGNWNLAKELLNQEIPYEHREKALFAAVRVENLEIVKDLIDSGVRMPPSITEEDYQYPDWRDSLILASSRRNIQLIRTLIYEAGIKPEMIEGSNNSVLIVWNAISGLERLPDMGTVIICKDLVDLEIINLLLDAEARINGDERRGNRREIHFALVPIYEAVRQGHLELVRLLLQRGANVKKKATRTPILEILFKLWNNVKPETAMDMAKELIEAGANVEGKYIYITPIGEINPRSFDPPTILNCALWLGSIELVQYLFGAGFESNPDNLYDQATKARHHHLTQWLLDQDILPDKILMTMQRAIDNGWEDIVQRLLTAARKDQTKWTFSQLSCHAGAIEGLLNSGITPRNVQELNHALISAATAGKYEVVQRLLSFALENGDDWDVSQLKGISFAILAHHYDIAELLISFGVEVDSSAIWCAIENANPIFAQLLLNEAALPKKFNISIDNFFYITTIPDPSIVQIVLERCRMNPFNLKMADFRRIIAEDSFNNLLMLFMSSTDRLDENLFDKLANRWVAEEGDTKTLRLLHRLGVDPSHNGILTRAVKLDDREMMRQIFQEYERRYSSRWERHGQMALTIAIEELNVDMVRMILELGVEPHRISGGESRYRDLNQSAFATAIKLDRTENLAILSAIIEKEPEMNGIVKREDRQCITALILAIEQGYIPSIQLLIDAGADPNLPATRQTQRNPLQAACAVGNLEAVQVLLQHEVDVNSPAFEVNGATALQFAAISGHIGIAATLLRRGADPNALPARINGRTAVEGAAEHGRVDMIRLLLDNGAKVTERAIKFARRNGHVRATYVLEVAHAKCWKPLLH
jgi:ankyrin repeat protein